MILAELPKELKDKYPSGTIMWIRKPLYGIAESGAHWFATYQKHHLERLHMEKSTYDECFLISQKDGPFAVIAMQVDDTLGLTTRQFADNEDAQLLVAEFPAKEKEFLSIDHKLIFNGAIYSLTADGIIQLRQKDQATKLQLVDLKADPVQRFIQYRQQRARGAYIASTCQPEAAFDLSVAAQHQEPTDEDVTALNKRLQWQMDNIDRGIDYKAVGLEGLNLYVFVDGSFANNKDLSSQIGYTIFLGTEENLPGDEFRLKANLNHYSSTKCKRVTRAVLASELYAMVAGIDMGLSISSTLNMIMERLGLQPCNVICCTDSYSIYECLVKLGTTKEKRLMIDIMALRQSYERREIFEFRWIVGDHNPADAMTKGVCNKALKEILDTNELTIGVKGWVKRSGSGKKEKLGKDEKEMDEEDE